MKRRIKICGATLLLVLVVSAFAVPSGVAGVAALERPTYGVELTVDGGNKTANQSVRLGENATYNLSLTNAGNATDRYTLNFSNPYNATTCGLLLGAASLKKNLTTAVLAPGERANLTLVVGNSTEGVFEVNVTSTSVNDPANATDFVNTTTTVGTAPTSPSLVSYTISNRTITPPQTTEIDVRFSEQVEAWIKIEDSERNLVNELYHSPAVTNPKPKIWDATFTNGTLVGDGDYFVNVTGTCACSSIECTVTNDTEIITVTLPPDTDTTPPAVTDPTATPETILADGVQTSLLSVTVKDETAVDTVVVNLSQIGGSPAQVLELINSTLSLYGTTTNAAVGTPPGTYNLTVSATDIYGNSNASVSFRLTVTEPRLAVSISTDKTDYAPGETMQITLNLSNPTPADQMLLFAWYFAIPDYGYQTAVVAPTLVILPAGCDFSFLLPMPVGDWGATDFNATWSVELLNPLTYSVVDDDTAEWRYTAVRAAAGAEIAGKEAAAAGEEAAAAEKIGAEIKRELNKEGGVLPF